MINDISTEVISRVLVDNNNEPTPELLSSIVTSYSGELKRVRSLYDRYQADSLPIKDKSVQNANWSNYKLRANLEGHIVRLYAGFMNPYATSYSVPKEKQALIGERLSRWTKQNVIEKIDAETLQHSCACGMAYVYVNQGDQSVYNLRPYEVIPIFGVDASRLDYALRYFRVNAFVQENGQMVHQSVEHFEWYAPNKIIFYERGTDGKLQMKNSVDSRTGKCPVVMIRFNGNMESNYSDVVEMCDAYREILSTSCDETINIKWAILKFLGMAAPDSTVKDANGDTEEDRFARMMKKAFSLFIPGAAGQTGTIDVQWLSKQIPKDFIEFMLNKLYEQILVLTETFDPDYAAHSAAISTVTGPGMDFKLLSMKSKCQMAKTYFISGMRRVLELVIAGWNIVNGSKLDPLDIDIAVNFNIPVDRLSEIQFLQQANGVLSQRTALSLSLLVKDPNSEIEQMKLEAEERRSIYQDLDKEDEAGDEDVEEAK